MTIMNKLPPYLHSSNTSKPQKSICLILEGFEEYIYFSRLKELQVFSPQYYITPINAKSALSVPAKYQDALSSNSYSSVLIVCDMDKKPVAYFQLLEKIKTILGPEHAEKVITFTRPCTLQVILSHFGDDTLTTQSKAAAIEPVQRLTGVKNYNAHQDQIKEICKKITKRSWKVMLTRISQLSTNPSDLPSTNMSLLFERLCSDDVSWIEELNTSIGV